eukprot:10084858-Ditylum_brightwellii.AAC.1
MEVVVDAKLANEFPIRLSFIKIGQHYKHVLDANSEVPMGLLKIPTQDKDGMEKELSVCEDDIHRCGNKDVFFGNLE